MESSQRSVFKMKHRGIFCFCRRDHNTSHQQDDLRSSKHVTFNGNNENFIKNGEMLLRDRISLFNGQTNPIRCFSVDDLNSMNGVRSTSSGIWYVNYAGVWNGKSVLVTAFRKPSTDIDSDLANREIAVATQMGTHSNVHRLLGYCLHTEYPVLVYEWPQNGTLSDRILDYKEHKKEPLEGKHRLRVAWEIAHVAAYLHTAFRRPLIHRELKPKNVYLDQDDSAKLSSFGGSISIPEGKTFVEDCILLGTVPYMAPECYSCNRWVAESSDVYSFGILLLVIMTGKPTTFSSKSDGDQVNIVDWVTDSYAASSCVTDIVDPTITTNGAIAEQHLINQLKALLELALRCSASDYECRPTMEDVATQIKSMITSLSDSQ